LVDAVNQSDLLFSSVLSLDSEALAQHAEEQLQQQSDMMSADIMSTAMGGAGGGGNGKPGGGNGNGAGQKSMAGSKLPSFKLASSR
jgi:hypothetical protein